MTLRQGQGNETHSFFDVQYNIPEHICKERQMGRRGVVPLGSLPLPHWRDIIQTSPTLQMFMSSGNSLSINFLISAETYKL